MTDESKREKINNAFCFLLRFYKIMYICFQLSLSEQKHSIVLSEEKDCCQNLSLKHFYSFELKNKKLEILHFPQQKPDHANTYVSRHNKNYIKRPFYKATVIPLVSAKKHVLQDFPTRLSISEAIHYSFVNYSFLHSLYVPIFSFSRQKTLAGIV